MKYRLSDFGHFSEVVRENAKNHLEYEVEEGLNKRILQFKSYYDLYSPANIYHVEDSYKVIKDSSTKVLNNEALLNVYQDFEVRQRIVGILKLIASGPTVPGIRSDASEALERIGFIDAGEYLSKFENAEQVRENLFEQAALDFNSFEELTELINEVKEDEDTTKMDEVLAMFKKAGIDIRTNLYSDDTYNTKELATLSDKHLNLLIPKDNLARIYTR